MNVSFKVGGNDTENVTSHVFCNNSGVIIAFVALANLHTLALNL